VAPVVTQGQRLKGIAQLMPGTIGFRGTMELFRTFTASNKTFVPLQALPTRVRVGRPHLLTSGCEEMDLSP
jgi:hypothetical protein